MKFLLVVLAVHFVAEVIRNKRKKVTGNNAEGMNTKIIHPAEFKLR